MNVFCDLHLHSCLSPCGDRDMTPNNLVRMAKLLGYDMIALTDHNSCRNCAAAVKVGAREGVTVVPGMELCTAEEIHCICLFPSVEAAEAFSDEVRAALPPVQNRPDIFGEQLVLDDGDRVVDTEPLLLTTASAVPLETVPARAAQYGGACFPAHLDRASYSVLSVLGMWYEELPFATVEFTPQAELSAYFLQHPLLRSKRIVRSSDAHYLENMLEPGNPLELSAPTPDAVLRFVRGEAQKTDAGAFSKK